MKTTELTRILAGGALAIGLVGAARAAQVSFSAKAPTLGPMDISNLKGAEAGVNNVSDGDNDATYIADDRPTQGQTFTTGTNSAGYLVQAVTLREVKHETYSLVPDLTYKIRITKPSGDTLSILDWDTAKVPASTPGNISSIGDGSEMGNGAGQFITFTLAKPVKLDPNTTYGFDVSGGTDRHYWQIDGTASNAYAGGVAYSVVGKDKFTPRTGDHVFVVALTSAKAPSASQTSAAPAAKPSTQQAATSGKTGSSE
jgi:hypothetical protein